MTRVRLDKWLWAARFFKMRSLATEAVSGGHVHVNGQRVKPARIVQLEDEITVTKGNNKWVVIVQVLSDKRGPAKVAQTLYEETTESQTAREADAAMRKYQRAGMKPAEHRPSGKDRNKIRKLGGKF